MLTLSTFIMKNDESKNYITPLPFSEDLTRSITPATVSLKVLCCMGQKQAGVIGCFAIQDTPSEQSIEKSLGNNLLLGN